MMGINQQQAGGALISKGWSRCQVLGNLVQPKHKPGKHPNCEWGGGGRIELVSLKLLKNCHVELIVIPHMVLLIHHHLPLHMPFVACSQPAMNKRAYILCHDHIPCQPHSAYPDISPEHC